jgi:hypothetical protein
VPTVTSWTVSDSATSATVGRLAFTASNGLTLTLSTSNNGNHTVIGSYTVPTITSWTVSDSATSATVGRLAFSNSNGVTFGIISSNNGQQTITASVAGASAGIASLANSQTTFTSGQVNLIEGGGAITIASTTGQSFKFSVPQTSSIIGTNGISISTNGSTISVSNLSAFNFTLSGNSSTVNSSVVTNGGYALAGGNGITLYQSNATISVSAGNSAGVNSAATNCGLTVNTSGVSVSVPYVSFFEPIAYEAMNNSGTTNWGNQTLFLQPFYVQQPISFDRVHMIGSVAQASTTAANTMSLSFGTSGQSQQFSATANVTNGNLVNLFLFSLGAGASSTDLQTAGSTQLSFLTNETLSYVANGTCGANSISMSISQSVSIIASFPAITSGTTTSVNAATTVTTWGMGYSTWNSSTTNSTSSGGTSNATQSISIAGTYPATTAWASHKLIPLPFATSLSAGQWWLGFNRSTTTSSGLTTSNTSVVAGRSYTSSVNLSNLTQTNQISWLGNTTTLASSLAFMGAGAAASLAPSPGHGTYSATYAASKTFMNNAGQANGEIAISDIATNISFWKPWFQLASNRI